MQSQCPPILRLSTEFGYKRPKVTLQDTFQNIDIMNDKLKDYIELEGDGIIDVPIGTHVRYITYDKNTKKQLFRTGGILHRKYAKYVILMGKECKTFSVQRFIYGNNNDIIYKTRFFKHLTKADKYNELIQENENDDDNIKNKLITQQQQKINELQSKLDKMYEIDGKTDSKSHASSKSKKSK